MDGLHVWMEGMEKWITWMIAWIAWMNGWTCLLFLTNNLFQKADLLVPVFARYLISVRVIAGLI